MAMLDFLVNDMSCGHCAAAITRAIQAVDQGARVEVDLDRKRVRVEPVSADARAVMAAIAEAGYTALSAGVEG
jgi:copper chaperone